MELVLSNETLKAMIRDYNGLDHSDEELALVRPELDMYMEKVKNLEALDLSAVLSVCLQRAQQGG